MDEEHIKSILRKLAEHEIPASGDLWPVIQKRAHRSSVSPRHLFMPSSRLGWIALIGGILLISVITVYAIDSILKQAIHLDVGLQYVEQAGLGKNVNVEKTVGDFTVTLQWVYADSDRISVGYIIRSFDKSKYAHLSAVEMALSGDNYTTFPWLSNIGVGGETGIAGYITSFDAINVQSVPVELQLHLRMKILGAGPTQNNSLLVGPFSFDFTVPFIPGRDIDISQTVTASGVAVTLKRITVTPSELRAYLCFDSPDPGYEQWTPTVHFVTGTGQTDDKTSISGGTWIKGTNCYRYSIFAVYYNQPGSWQLTVPDLVGVKLTPQVEQKRLVGPWAFQFRMP